MHNRLLMQAMDENDYVCPLCCEELDISDRQFFPCKCGYQVCMWCWHRIRESESGLCPACRTPYGDDPHEFSAVDVEEVLKANKEKEAAAKRERIKLQQQQHQQQPQQNQQMQLQHSQQQQQLQQGLSPSSDGEGDNNAGAAARGPMEVPKDRTQLANMRVIRRNLVYAVGLPPSIASEETLRKPEYFGQYGKIVKIVLNRSQITGDPRRASASAYVTFAHKEDTLSCILALDGFYLEGRNIRASYGTSKYCSAFIKNVRCNNPECTYLHEMGDIEDTFTKQEIQAGYVTSGRDVLARQQQIMAQALSAASAGASGPPRRRVGGGGPTGTGKASANPVFPPPSFDEPFKPSATSLVPPAAGLSRASSTGPAVSAIPPVPAGAKILRAATAGQAPASTGNAKSVSSSQVSLIAASRKGTVGNASSVISGAPQVATAASVVAGVHNVAGLAPEAPAPHTTLTPLTPLKRAQVKSMSKSALDDAPSMPLPKGVIGPDREQGRQHSIEMPGKLSSLRNGSVKVPMRPSHGAIGTAPTSPSSSVSSSSGPAGRHASLENSDELIHSIGGTLLPAPGPRFETHSARTGDRTAFSGGGIGLGSLSRSDEDETLGVTAVGGVGNGGLGSLGGDIFNGPLHSSGPVTAIGSGKDKWNSGQIGGATIGQGVSASSGSNLWGDSGFPLGAPTSKVPNTSAGVIGGRPTGGFAQHGVIGGPPIGSHNPGSSALASMLGISLPTGSGSLHESRLWELTSSSTPENPALTSAFGPSHPSQGVIGPGSNSNNGIIGGATIGRSNGLASFGREHGSNSNSNDIALLQSLLPGVHITSGNLHQAPAAGYASFGHDWGAPVSSSSANRHFGGFIGENIGAASNWGLPANLANGAGAIGPRNRQQVQKEHGTNTSVW